MPSLVVAGLNPICLVETPWNSANQAKWQLICPHCGGLPCVGWEVMAEACGCAIEGLPNAPPMAVHYAVVWMWCCVVYAEYKHSYGVQRSHNLVYNVNTNETKAQFATMPP